MNSHIPFLLGVLQITLLDMALCGDNIGVIALATRNLPDKSAKLASLIGITGAILLRIYFAACLSVFIRIKWLPIRLIGGIILIKVTWDLIKPQNKKETHHIKEAERFWDAVISVLLADITMSLDNVLAIAGAANGNILLVMFGIILNVPIIFLGSQIVVDLMKKHALIVYFGGAILAFTSVNMILEDYWFKSYIHLSSRMNTIIPLISAIATVVYGIFMIKGNENKGTLPNKRFNKAS